MSWEAVTAVATLTSALVVGVAAIAAVVQIRHLRAGNQLQALLRIYDVFNGKEMVEARHYCAFELPPMIADRAALAAALERLDPRVTLVGNFYNELGALVVDGNLDERLIWPLLPVAAQLWTALLPITAAYREARADPVWAHFEYVAALHERVTPEMDIGRYPAWFQERLRASRALPAPQEPDRD